MKKLVIVFVALLLIFAGCKKNLEVMEPTPSPAQLIKMSDLVVNAGFDWKLFKTLDVTIILPNQEANPEKLRIKSATSDKIYFSGYPEDGSNTVRTKVTLPTHVDNVLLQYGDGSEYPIVNVMIQGNFLNYDLNNLLKGGGGGMPAECCEGQVTWLKLKYLGTTGKTIKVVGKKSTDIFFEEFVQPNELFEFVGDPTKSNKMGAKIKMYENGTFTTEIHTSCSQDIYTGMTFDNFYVEDGTSHGAGPLCPWPGGGDDDDDDDDDDFEGTLAFEDLWPGKGDYDFNDLVVDYTFAIQKNVSEEIEQVTATFIIYAFGASFHNGFGFTFPNVSPSSITSVTGYNIASGSIFNLSPNGTESGQSAATFIGWDDSYRLMPHPGSGIGVNTTVGSPYVTPVTIVMEIVFVDGAVTYSELDIGNFNPFIVVDQTRGHEVHLPDYVPTSLVDPSYFGTANDDSDPTSNRYYVTENNLPWGINIPDVFEYPIEMDQVLWAYLNFASWAESGGAVNDDWYMDKPGYRDDNYIY
ncbi:MAG: LruC domain-containing protein [Bacteroidetes bacterium]|nr:LruC domain-containing protein [Bacteroidota bacterium]